MKCENTFESRLSLLLSLLLIKQFLNYCCIVFFKHVILHQKKSETTYGLSSIRTIDGVGNRESLTFQGGGN